MRGWPVVIVFLWDVRTLNGGSARGVTDDEIRARLAASDVMRDTGVMGRIERAYPLAGGAWLTDGYRRLGSGWSAELHGGRMRWVAFRDTVRDPLPELERAS
jgi:hypothetical protein